MEIPRVVGWVAPTQLVADVSMGLGRAKQGTLQLAIPAAAHMGSQLCMFPGAGATFYSFKAILLKFPS